MGVIWKIEKDRDGHLFTEMETEMGVTWKIEKDRDGRLFTEMEVYNLEYHYEAY